MASETTPQPRKKNWLCIYPGCNEPLKTHYNCYSHVWDGHLRHLAASPIYGGVKGEVYKKLSNRTEAKKQCEMYMIEVAQDVDIESARAAGRARIGNPQLSLINSIKSESTDPLIPQQSIGLEMPNNCMISDPINTSPLTISNNSNNIISQNISTPSTWEYMTNNFAEEQLQGVLQQEDFIRIVQINENLKRLHVFGEVLAEGGFLQRSDKRSKEHIEPLQNCLDTILKLTGKSFQYINKPDIKYGFIAQEVKEICPELVHEDENGLSVDVIGVIPMLVEALKDIHSAASETKDDSTSKFEELSLLANSALERVKKYYRKINENELEEKSPNSLALLALKETNTFNFSLGPAVFTLVSAMILSLTSGYIAFALPELPAVWIYCWIVTIITWISCWRNRVELTKTISTRQLILYWKKQNSLSLYIFLFLGIIIIGMSIIMGNAVITLCVACVSVFFVLGVLGVIFNKKYKLSFSIIFAVLILFLLIVVVVIMALFIVQPDYQCSINDNANSYTLQVQLNEMSEKQIIAELPWNCWSSQFEFSDDLPPGFIGVSDSDTSPPYIQGVPQNLFPTTSVGVYVKCIDFVKFYCGTITFQTCEGRGTVDDCVGNGCSWDNETGVCQ